MKTRAWLPIVLLLALSSQGFAQDTRDTDGLRGLAGVAVRVTGLKQEVERDGLSKAQLQTDVELRLRKAGIRVLTEDQWLIAPGQPTLSVIVALYKVSNPETINGYAKSVDVVLRQNVVLSRTPSTIVRGAITWQSTLMVGVSNSTVLQNDIRERVADVVDEFINAFLAANPK
jgi:hypothetical protein